MANPMSLLLILLLVPLVWSALIQIIRHMASQKATVLHDRVEKAIMAVMLMPLIVGAGFLVISPFSEPLAESHILYPPAFAEVTQIATNVMPKLTPQGPDFISLGIGAVLFIYVAGLIFSLWRVWQAHNQLARIVKTAQPTPLGQQVLRAEGSSPVFAWGKRRIIVPAVLFERLSVSELDLILAHERAHQGRGDPLYFLALSLIEALFWFNPLIARQGRACRLAAEMACDAVVVGKAPQIRKAYAKTLMIALKHVSGHTSPSVPTAFSDKDTYKLRFSQIMAQASRPRMAIVWLIAMLVLSAPVLMLQMAFAEGRKLPALVEISLPKPAEKVKVDTLLQIAPVDAPVSSPFGMRADPLTGKPRNHSGVDFNLAIGTPVKSPASGTVVAASGTWIPRETAPPDKSSGLTPRQNGWWGNYGMVVEIDHGNGVKTRFAHLDKVLVKTGDHVSEGQVVALSGDTGSSTQPHLHFEVWQKDKVINPGTAVALNTP